MKNRLHKILSIILTFALLMSVCSVCIPAGAEDSSVVRVFYVDSVNGSSQNDGLSAETPLTTIAEVIENCGDLDADDSIIVNAMGTTVNSGDLTTEYTATLYIQSADPTSKTTVTLRGNVSPKCINGPTVFRNVKLSVLDAETTRLYFGGASVTLESDVELSGINILAANSYANTNAADKYKIYTVQNMVFNNVLSSSWNFYLPNVGHCNGTQYYEDFNFIVNNEASAPKVNIDPDGNVTYHKNYNYFIKNAASFTHGAATNVVANAAFQVVVNSATSVNAATKTNLDTIGSTAKGGYYYVTVSDDVIDALSLTETAGKYAVAQGVNLQAVNTETLEEVKSENGYITLTEAGEWNITEYFPPVTRNYYVDSVNGLAQNDGLSVDTPVPTVADAVAKATDLDADDTIIANVVSTTADVGTFTEEFTPTLVIQSYSTENKSTVSSDATLGITGTAIFRNIDLVKNATTDNRLYLSGYSVTFEDDATTARTTIIYNKYNTNITHTSQKVVLKNAFTGSVKAANDGHYNGLKYTGDVDLVIDNVSSTPAINHDAYYGGNVTYEGNLNYFIKNAKSVGFGAVTNNTITLNDAMQVVINKNTTITDAHKTVIDTIGASAKNGYYYLTVDGADYIELTKDAGIYKIAEGYNATATNLDTLKEVASAEGELALTAGEWEVTVSKEPVVRDYYIKADGTGDGLSYESPVATVEAAVTAASDLIAGDTIRVNLIGETATLGTLPEYAATLYIQSADSNVKTTLSMNTNAWSNGPTVLKNITVDSTGTDYRLCLRGDDVTIESDVTLLDATTLTFNTYNTSSKYTGQTVTVKNNVNYSIFAANDGHFNGLTYSEDVNLIFDNASATPTIIHSTSYGGPVYYKKNLNYIIKNAKEIKVGALGSSNTVNITGALQVLVNTAATVSDASKTNIDAIGNNAMGGYYYLKVSSAAFEAIEMSSTAGKYKVKEGYQAVATKSDGTEKTSADGLLELEAGEWTITVREEQTTSRNEYINYRRDLSNTYSKLINDKEINVVYFGGSVTAGYGVDDADTQSWRGKIGAWLQNTFPNATINNINKAKGESGTFLGSYRLERDILSCEPDLLFLEYSINDKYDFATYERASMQYETIVRKVRKAYPDCDIVTILVTDSGVAEAARKENGSVLHTQAQAHEDIAAHYNIPTLHVGRYLADSLPENWTYDNDWKGNVAIDTVHLTEKGNDIYLEVIKEYMNNCLVYGGYDADNPVECDGLPEMVNDKLLDGNITYIQPTAEIIARSEELGGSGFTHQAGDYIVFAGYQGYFNVSSSATDPMLAMEFNGTELIAIMHNYSSDKKFQLKVDNGDWQEVAYYHMNPQTIVTGLEPGDHTVYFKPAFKDGETWQWIGAFFSRDDSKATTKADAGPITKPYYVKNGGTGDGRTPENPAPTVNAVIPSINADGLDENDIANIYVMQRDDWNTIPEGKIGTSASVGENVGNGIANGSNIVQPHFITSWAEKGGTLTTAHTAKIVLKSYDSNNKSYLAFSEYLGLNAAVGCNGPTVFDDVILVYTRNTYDTRIATNYNDVTFGSNLTYGFVNCTEFGSAHSWDGKVYSLGGAVAELKSDNSTRDSKVIINAPISKFYIPAGNYANPTLSHNIEIEVDAGTANTNFVWGSTHTNGCTATINGNLNFNVKSAGTISNSVGLNSTNKSTVIINGALQYIYSESVTLTNKPADLLIQVDETTKKGVVINGDAWYIKNTSGYGDLISYTAKPGTYKVDERYEVTAVNDDTNATVNSMDGELVLSAGNWTVSGVKIPVYKNYYVKNGGTGSGRTPETPAATVKQVIDAVNEDLVAGDIANIYIMQREDYNSVKNLSTGAVHNFTSWTTMDLGIEMTAHAAKIVIKPYDSEVTTYITHNDKYWTQADLIFGGDTEFEDVVIVDTRGNYDTARIGNKNVKFGKNTSYGVLNADSTVKIFANKVLSFYSNGSGNQKVELYNATSSQLWLAAPSYGTLTRTGDVNVVIDNGLATNKPALYWGMVHSSGTKKQEGNINILVKNAYSLTHVLGTSSYGMGTHTINGAVQMIIRSDVTVSGSPADFSDKVIIRDGIWDLRYVSDADDALEFTDITGQFKVKEGYTATAITADGTKIGSQDGILTLSAGKYMVYVNDEFSNTGEEILVHKTVEIDTETIYHEEKADKLFIGWKNKNSGEYAEKVATYNKGDVLVAVYVDYKSNTDFYYEEAMTTEDGGLRFIFSKDKSFFANLPVVLDMGALVLPTDDGGYYDLYLNEPVVKSWKWDEETKYDFQPNATGKTPATVKQVNVLEENEDTVKYTLCVTELAESKYTKFYSTKGYIKYEDHNGIVNVLYTEQVQASLYQASKMAEDKRDIDNTIITVSEKQLSDKKADYYSTRTLCFGSGAEDDVYNIYKYGGMNIRDVVIDTGIEGMTETDIFFVSDPHFNYISRKDITNGLETTLSSYRGRSWARDGWTISPSVNAVNFGASFDHMVMGGDAVDYISYGGLDVTSRVFTQRAVNDNITMVTGNHEVEELSQADMTLSNILSVEQRHKFCQPGWANDVYYSSRIINEKVMVIGLDNSRVIYWNSQLEPLTRDLQYARENGLAVLIFQHIPMLTMNPEETAYKFGNTHITDYFGTEENGKATDTVNMSTKSGYVGLKTDEATQEVCTLIRQNADIIKGVFHGHEHCNMYTEIVGLDANGNPTDARIPQHGIAGIHYNAAMAIKIK